MLGINTFHKGRFDQYSDLVVYFQDDGSDERVVHKSRGKYSAVRAWLYMVFIFIPKSFIKRKVR